MLKCIQCGNHYEEDDLDESFETSLCCRCFEESLEEYEEVRRQKIAERNEY